MNNLVDLEGGSSAAAGGSTLDMRRYLTWIVDHRRWVIAATLVLTVFFGLFASRQQVIINPAAVVPQGHPYIQATNTIERIFGSKYLVVIGVTPASGDALQPEVVDTVRRITDRLYESPTVSKQTLLSLTSRQAKGIEGSADSFEARPLVDGTPDSEEASDAIRQAIERNPVYRDTVLSSDGRTATILLELKENANGFGAMLADVNRILAQEKNPDLRISISGNPVFLHQAEIFADRINWLFPIAVLVIGLLHFEAFRTVQGLVLPLVTAVLSVVWGVGVMGLLGVPMDIFNSPTPILILAVAAGHAVQLLKRYYETYVDLVKHRGMVPLQANREATIASLSAVGPVMVIAGGVAALGFFSLVVFDVETVRAFGIFTGIGILTAVILEFTFTPAVRASLRPPSMAQIDTETRPRVWDRISGAIASAVLAPTRRRWILALIAAVVATAVIGGSRVQIDNASKTFFADSLPIQQDDNLLNASTGGTNVLYVMVDTGQADGVKDPEVLSAIRDLQREAARREFVGKTLSIDDFLRRMHGAASGEALPSDTLPADRDLIAQYLFLYSLSGDPEDFSGHVDYEYQRAKVSIMLRTNSNAEIESLVGDLTDYVAKRFPKQAKVSFGGEVAQTLAVTDVMVRSKLLNIAQILAVIFVVAAVAFRSALAGLLVLAPLVVVVTLVFGVMGYAGVPLNIPNSLISAMAVGIGADYAIYLIYRVREYVAQGLSLPDAVGSAVRTAGKACLFVATAVAGGYAVLLFSYDYKVHMWLSTFIIIAMLGAVLTALTLIPSAILALKPAFVTTRRSGDRGAAILIVLATIGFLTYSQVAWSATPGAAELMERNWSATRFPSSQGSAEFVLETKSGAKRVRRAEMSSRLSADGQGNQRFVRFEAPADIRGTSTLLIENAGKDDDMWVYLPAMKRVRRLIASNKRDSFIGTDFSYGDVMGHRVADWKHTLVGERTREGVAHYVVESVPASDKVATESGYSKRISWLRKDNHVATFVEVFDRGGKPYKQFAFSDIRAMAAAKGKWQPMKAVGSNLQSGHRTTISFSRFDVGMAIDDRVFSPNAMSGP
jgi:predicted RND superfamily exporter protein